MTREELDENLDKMFRNKTHIGLVADVVAVREEFKQLIRDCIEAVTPEKVFEIKADTYSAGVHDGINHAVSDLEANTKDLLG